MRTIYYVRCNNETLDKMRSNGYYTNFQKLLKDIKKAKKETEKKYIVYEFKLTDKYEI